MQLQTYVLAVIDTERRYVSHHLENKHKCLICVWSIKSAGRRRKKKTQIPIENEAGGWLQVNVRGKSWKIIWRSLAVKVVDWHLCWSWAITWTPLTGSAGQPLKNLSSRRVLKPRRSSNIHRRAEELSCKPTGGGYLQPLVFGVQCNGEESENSRRH